MKSFDGESALFKYLFTLGYQDIDLVYYKEDTRLGKQLYIVKNKLGVIGFYHIEMVTV